MNSPATNNRALASGAAAQQLAEQTMRALANLPAPEGLVDRVQGRIQQTRLRSDGSSAHPGAHPGTHPGRLLAWPTRIFPTASWSTGSWSARATAAVALLCVGVAIAGWGLGWGIHAVPVPAGGPAAVANSAPGATAASSAARNAGAPTSNPNAAFGTAGAGRVPATVVAPLVTRTPSGRGIHKPLAHAKMARSKKVVAKPATPLSEPQ